MGETLDETRLEIAGQRVEIEATVARMREALDIRRRFRENPALVVGVGAATVFLVVGGPRRLVRALRRHLSPTAAEQAYDALPAPMQAWVETLAESAGPKALEVRNALVEELRRWRHDPVKDRKAREALARQMVEGPPGPSRTAWKATEAALTLVAAALARRAIARFLTDEPDGRDAAAPSGPVASANASPGGEAAYTGFSTMEKRAP